MSSQTTRENIQRLAEKRPGVTQLDAAANPDPILAKTGLGSIAKQQTAAEGGIASPLTEDDYGARTWYGEEAYVSSDGVFTFYLAMVESITMKDANGDQVVFNYAAPA